MSSSHSIYCSRLPNAAVLRADAIEVYSLGAIEVCSLGKMGGPEENSLSTITVLLQESLRMVLFELYITISYSVKFTKMFYYTIQMT